MSELQKQRTAESSRNRVWTAEMREKIATANRQRVITQETRARHSASRKGRSISASHRANIVASRTDEVRERIRKALSGSNSPRWRGGSARDGRDGASVQIWKRQVHKRDNDTCQWCGTANLTGRNRQADHVMAWAEAPDMRFEVWNGRTLCLPCHSMRTASQMLSRNKAQPTSGQKEAS